MQLQTSAVKWPLSRYKEFVMPNHVGAGVDDVQMGESNSSRLMARWAKLARTSYPPPSQVRFNQIGILIQRQMCLLAHGGRAKCV